MTKKLSEIVSEKVDFIYEFNNSTPLFARKASFEIEKKNYTKAIEILNRGIETYPEYPVPYFILGKAQALSGNLSSALKSIRTGSDLIHSKKTYEFYLKELELLKNQQKIIEISEEDTAEKTEEKIKENDKKVSVDERLTEIAKEISNAKIPEITKEKIDVKPPAASTKEENMIVSDTLAKIYIAQGEVAEAIKVYERLIIKDKSKEEYYQQRIKELKSKLGS